MSGHTPGPWALLRGFPSEIVPEGHQHRHNGGSVHEVEDRELFALIIARADRNEYSSFAHEITKEQQRANARLIAAAPDLLDAILNSDDAHWTPAMRAAIAKATGAP